MYFSLLFSILYVHMSNETRQRGDSVETINVFASIQMAMLFFVLALAVNFFIAAFSIEWRSFIFAFSKIELFSIFFLIVVPCIIVVHRTAIKLKASIKSVDMAAAHESAQSMRLAKYIKFGSMLFLVFSIILVIANG